MINLDLFIKSIETYHYQTRKCDMETTWRSITELIDDPYYVTLKHQLHENNLKPEHDPEGTCITAIGHAFEQFAYSFLEKTKFPWQSIIKDRFRSRDQRISGEVDMVLTDWRENTYQIIDCKVTSIARWLMHPLEEDHDWVRQINGYRWLYEPINFHNLKCTGLKVLVYFKDWKKPYQRRTKADNDSRYPELPIGLYDLPIIDLPTTEQWINDRIKVHKQPLSTSGCENKWESKAGPIRCKHWCGVSDVCPWYQSHKITEGNSDDPIIDPLELL